MTSLPAEQPAPAGQPDWRDPMDAARDEIARQIEAEFPGRTVTHDVMGWLATREGADPVRAQSHVALRALLPYCGD